MFKGHPKGLIVAFFTNMGERFGFYTMMAILVLFLQVKYGLTEEVAGNYYSWFYFAIYALALAGGLLADWKKQYKTVILIGQIIMFAGYVMIALPGMSLGASFAALLVISLGNGLFKGNLQAVVGQMYDSEEYAKKRDAAFMVFYMGINIGAFFAPYIATGVRDWWLKINGFMHDGGLPSLCHKMLNGTLSDTTQFQELANKAMLNGQPVTDLNAFAQQYIDVFARGYNWAFAIAAGAMIVSLLVYIIFNKTLPNVSKKVVEKKADNNQKKSATPILISLGLMLATAVIFYLTLPFKYTLNIGLPVGLFVAFISYVFMISKKEERSRVVALSLVFVVVIFFWMSFHQNGLTLTFFARDYIVQNVDPFTYSLFTLGSIMCIIAAVGGFVALVRKNSNAIVRAVGAIMMLAFGYLTYRMIQSNPALNPIGPEVFQSFNPLYIVLLTPVVMGFFAFLNKRGKEPSTPKKIGFGMIIASLGFVVVLVASIKLVSPYLLGDTKLLDADRVSPYWLLGTYFVLTIAELFLSPMGLSFVSKVAPPRFQGLMQGGWLLATAVGNKLLIIGSLMWGKIELTMLWGIFIICCIASAIFIFSIMKRLEKVTS